MRNSERSSWDHTISAMAHRRLRLFLYIPSFVGLVILYTFFYWWGMAVLEGQNRTLLEALGIVIQSLTTTGYGQDAPWQSPQLNVLVMIMQFTGIAYLFIAFPVFIIPRMRELTEPTVPESADDLSDHVILCGYSALCASLVEELEAREIDYVVIESDEDHAQELENDDKRVMLGDPTDGGSITFRLTKQER